jgi:hypothetical protein
MFNLHVFICLRAFFFGCRRSIVNPSRSSELSILLSVWKCHSDAWVRFHVAPARPPV